MTNTVPNPGELVLFQAGAMLYKSLTELRYSEHNEPHVKFPVMWDDLAGVSVETLCPTPVLILRQCFRHGQRAPHVLGYETLVEDRIWFIKASTPYKRVK